MRVDRGEPENRCILGIRAMKKSPTTTPHQGSRGLRSAFCVLECLERAKTGGGRKAADANERCRSTCNACERAYRYSPFDISASPIRENSSGHPFRSSTAKAVVNGPSCAAVAGLPARSQRRMHTAYCVRSANSAKASKSLRSHRKKKQPQNKHPARAVEPTTHL